MDTLLQHLADWGCDVGGALERLADDEALYITCLQMFTTDAGFAELRAALDKQDMPAAFDAAHTLKGVSANLGLTPLSAAIALLVEDLRAQRGDRLETLWQTVDAATQTFRTLAAAGA